MKLPVTLIFSIIISSAVFSQAIGYQGKNFVLSAGYIPANNVSAIIFDRTLEDDYYSNNPDKPDENDPIIFLHMPKVELEYAAMRYGSVFIRYNSYKQTSNILYYDLATEQPIDFVGLETKGNMISLGYRFYTSGNIAPLGAYVGLYGTFFNYTASFSDSKFADDPAPQEFKSFPASTDEMIGAFVQYGVKSIFWDRVVLDVQIDGGYFFKNAKQYFSRDYAEDEFGPYRIGTNHDPLYYAAKNSRIFFIIAPSLNLGVLLF